MQNSIQNPLKRFSPVFFLLVLAVFSIPFLPWGKGMRDRLKNLSPELVVSASFSQTPKVTSDSLVVTLTTDEIKQFLALLRKARLHSPNHPIGGWTVFVSIDVVDSEDFYFGLHSTKNTGTYASLYSDGLDGWNMGNLRNDDLKSFIEDIFSSRRIKLPAY